MATFEHEHLLGGPRARPRERHVFVSQDGRRQRLLRAAGLAAGLLALAWLAALALAMAGSTRLPGLPVPAVARPVPARAASHAVTALRGRSVLVPSTSLSAAATRTVEPSPPRGAPIQADAIAPSAPAPFPPVGHQGPAAPRAPAAAPARAVTRGRQQGWARRGWTAPPGQTRRKEPPRHGMGHSTGATATSSTHGNGHGKG